MNNDMSCRLKSVTAYCDGRCIIHYKCITCGRFHDVPDNVDLDKIFEISMKIWSKRTKHILKLDSMEKKVHYLRNEIDKDNKCVISYVLGESIMQIFLNGNPCTNKPVNLTR